MSLHRSVRSMNSMGGHRRPAQGGVGDEVAGLACCAAARLLGRHVVGMHVDELMRCLPSVMANSLQLLRRRQMRQPFT